MDLKRIETNTTWNDAAAGINSNNAKIDTEVEKLKNATYKHKGYFKTLADLQTVYPTSSLGSVAWVGTQYPFTLYRWIMRTGWTTDGTTGGDENLDLSQYYTKEEVDAAIAEYNTVLPQELYDRLVIKEDKLYFTTESEDDFEINPVD